MRTKIQAVTFVTDSLGITLANCRENKGHDDSLPYQADIYLCRHTKTVPQSFEKIGEVFNDGWGGCSEVSLISNPELTEDIQNVLKTCEQHPVYYHGKPLGNSVYSLDNLCDAMAEVVIGAPEVQKQGTVLFRFDDDPVAIANGGHNGYLMLGKYYV